ncbi:hypothetical protein CVT24_008714 [Panaeolus cyanescens]|uniref:DNA replication factor Cdt1 C-terminal domain-containing protein n=1 Tax=Panaeolus cyanescens TaxID=181874 RepID=A0A409VKK1_9AGAR|nr:hypothetical protein CVT24_008714 [Panaeolus cyanescens]
MAELYASLNVSPKKKRALADSDDTVFSPKKLRRMTPSSKPSSSSVTRRDQGVSSGSAQNSLPPTLSRLFGIQTSLQYALSHALATCAISPTADSGIVKNVLNHISVMTYSGFPSSFEIADLKRLCWIWEWDGQTLNNDTMNNFEEEEENPFVDSPKVKTVSSEWTRGSMGFVISPATQYSKSDRKRIPAYGIGIEVEMDLDKDMGAGMAAVARWTASSDKRCTQVRNKLELWAKVFVLLFEMRAILTVPKLHREKEDVPEIPCADIPDLAPPKISNLTRTLASCSPSAVINTLKFPEPPSSPSSSPAKRLARPFAQPPAIDLLQQLRSPAKKSSIAFPQTPSRRDRFGVPGSGTEPPQTPTSALSSPSKNDTLPSLPMTPVHQRSSEGTPVQTPSTSRRDALYERIRQRSLSASPTKGARLESPQTKLTRDQLLKMNQDEMRRRCLLGRLGGVAESIWMLFSNPTASGSSTPSRKRKALPMTEVTTAIIKSSPVPISNAEAMESISMLLQMCPFFLKKLEFSGDEWLEMPASAPQAPLTASVDASPTKQKTTVPASPGRLKFSDDSAHELVTRSPRRVKREMGGLREVREIIRRELELQD